MCKKRIIYTMSELSLAMTATFNSLNRDLFNNELEKVVITFEGGYKKGAFGWITCGKTWKQGQKERHNINISSDYFDRPIDDIVATLVHEMCHLYAIQNGIKDTSRAGIYHNKAFKEIAIAHYLNVFHTDTIGYCTSCSDTLSLWVKENCSISAIRLVKDKPQEGGKVVKPKQSARKYICPKCGLIVRATKDCKIMCMECSQEMALES